MKDVPEDLKQIVDKKYIPNSIIKRDEDFYYKKETSIMKIKDYFI